MVATSRVTWWAPHQAGWWTGVLFAVGSLCFAVGSVPAYLDAVGTTADAVTYFVGSLFFTTAAGLQWRGAHRDGERLDRWAGGVQFVGTLMFNISTFAAVLDPPADRAERLVWTPDARGSVCFLVASGLAWWGLGRGLWSWRPQNRDWSIAALNLAGSIAFGVSAVASYVVPTTDQVRNVTLMNLGTFLGAIGFLLAALLLLPRPATT